MNARWCAAAALLLATTAIAGTSRAASAPAFHVRLLRFVDHARRAHLLTGASVPRTLVTVVRVPSRGRPPYPLVVFAHGFVLLPSDYARLLDSWARAGYVVAAPEFPLENTHAVGGPTRADLMNEPGDLRFVLDRLLARSSPVRASIDPTRIAVAGHSDGGVAALSAALDRRYADRRIDAAIVMSGAAPAGFAAAGRALPLLAVQGTADPLNSPATTAAYFAAARRPKFLLWLEGAGHKEPFTTADRWSGAVERETTDFLDHYLRGGPLHPLLAAGTLAGIARLQADP